MKTLPALFAALILFALSGWAAAEAVLAPSPLLDEAPIEAEETTPAVPEPRSMIFVGLGALIILSFALRRK